jgi:hypothetical protein
MVIKVLILLFLTSLGCSNISFNRNKSFPVGIKKPLVFLNESFEGSISKDKIDRLLKLKVSMGNINTSEQYYFLTSKEGKRISASTSTEYLEAKRKGAYPKTTADISMDSWFRHVTGTLKFASECKPSIQRQWKNDILEILPVTLLNWVGSDEREKLEKDSANGINLKLYMSRGNINKWKPKPNELSFSHNGVAYNIEILATGDHDNDGNEDLLAMAGYHYEGGSGRGYQLYIISKIGSTPVNLIEFGILRGNVH